MSAAENQSITAPKGFLAAGVHCGLKSTADPDLGIILCTCQASAAGVFTNNELAAAPVTVCREHISGGKGRTILVNAGNANACTGQRGLDDALAMTRGLADSLNLENRDVLPASTGVIGQYLDMDKIKKGTKGPSADLADTPEAGMNFARAILTTDTCTKTAYRQFDFDGRPVRLAGVAKGSGMIAPNMATMLAFITTDICISPDVLHEHLLEAVSQTFNRITVDGQCSTNDCVLVLASGMADNKVIAESQGSDFGKHLHELCDELALAVVSDGEGATKLIHVQVSGAKSFDQAHTIARALADNLLIKTAMHGSDPNWGRILYSAGACRAGIDPSKLICKLGGVEVFSNGVPTPADQKQLKAALAKKEICIDLDLQQGQALATVHTCDLSEQYVQINAFYHT